MSDAQRRPHGCAPVPAARAFAAGGPVAEMQARIARRLDGDVAPPSPTPCGSGGDAAARLSRLSGPVLFGAAWVALAWFALA